MHAYHACMHAYIHADIYAHTCMCVRFNIMYSINHFGKNQHAGCAQRYSQGRHSPIDRDPAQLI